MEPAPNLQGPLNASLPQLPKTSALRNTIVVVLILIVLSALAWGLYFLTQTRRETGPAQTSVQKPNVAPKREYSNPFEKSTQYVNPFSDYKNPFDNLVR